jgi:cytochrome P450
LTVASPAVSGDPIEFDPYSDDFFDSPYETYRRMRDEAPVYYNATYNFYALSRYEDVAPAYKDFETYSSASGYNLDLIEAARQGEEVPKFIITMDPPEHHRMRKLVSKTFTPRAMELLESMVNDQIRTVAAGIDTASFDVVKDFSALFPIQIITNMLGVPVEDREQVRLWVDMALSHESGSTETSERTMEGTIALWGYYHELTELRHREPKEDMISHLTRVEITDDDGELRRLDDIEIAGFATLLAAAGAETVAKLIGNAAVIFADYPGEWQKLLDDRSKIPAAVEELLRYQPPNHYNVRRSMRDVTVHGVTIPAGSSVMLLIGSAMRDDRVFPEGDRFDVDRQRPFGYNLAFGYGIHSCLGAALARMESRMAINALLDLIPKYTVDRSGLQRVHMTNVCGWANVPVRAL